MPTADEFALIRLLTSGREGPSGQGVYADGVVLGIGDDAAVLDGAPGYQWVVSCDTMVQDVHFNTSTMTYQAIGYKAMASNISDMAAMGAIPRFALVALSIPRSMEESQLLQLYDGLYRCAGQYGVAVVGGDTTSTPHGMTVTVTILGQVEAGRALLRSRAQIGDIVFLTGKPGMSAGGLHWLLERNQPAEELGTVPEELRRLIAAHQEPQPHVEAGRILVESGLGHALNDVSDGVASEAWELAEASGCRLMLEETRIPLDYGMVTYAQSVKKDPLDWVLNGGEDYILIGTAGADAVGRLQELFANKGLELVPIGTVKGLQPGEAPGVTLIRKDRTLVPVHKKGYNHFQS